MGTQTRFVLCLELPKVKAGPAAEFTHLKLSNMSAVIDVWELRLGHTYFLKELYPKDPFLKMVTHPATDAHGQKLKGNV